MRRTVMLWEVFVLRFEEAFEQYKRGRKPENCWECRAGISGAMWFAMKRMGSSAGTAKRAL
jgi:hypothetical protein